MGHSHGGADLILVKVAAPRRNWWHRSRRLVVSTQFVWPTFCAAWYRQAVI
jgi:hypothetical protein